MIDERPDISFSQTRTMQDHINVDWWMKELMLSYKYGEKGRYRRALDNLGPYMSDTLKLVFEDVYKNSLWTNPITGKKG